MKAETIKALFPFLSWFGLINRKTLRADFMAGVTGAVIVLPQGVAFATIAGLPPQYGLYTAMVTPIIAALFGSSRHLISGPTTAISIVIFASVSRHAMPGTEEFITLALTMTFLAGIYQLAFGLARMGMLVNFVSHTVVMGFTAGAAILIVTSQMKNVLGIEVPRGESFAHTWVNIAESINSINIMILAVAMITLVTAIVVKRLYPKLPHLLIGLITGAFAAIALGGEASGITFIGQIPSQLPPFSLPDFSISTIREMAPEAFAVALLGLIEAVSISRSVATKSHQRIDGNQEFVGQGLSNIVGSFFSSYAGSGSFTRSGINYQAGAETPMSAIFAAVLLMAAVLLIAPLTAYLPVAAMGGVILLVAYGLVDFHHIESTVRKNRSETMILVVTFLSTLFLELEFAIYLGVLLSILIFLARTSKPEMTVLAPDPQSPTRKFISVDTKPISECPQIKFIRIDRSIYFGSLNYIQCKLGLIADKEGIKNIVIDASKVNYIDAAGAEMLVMENERLRKKGGGLYFYGLESNVWEFLAQGKYIKSIGSNAFFDHKSKAVAFIYKTLDIDTCDICTKRIFRECSKVSG
ncbi:SulP family inorganic anion transporter [Sulfuriflexus mobilis]|uniref:SulP family inorganic anion transporter n=1 Tax=Sulfuriflexus mobilis TaxID=1811807 RepID=UPI000F81A428|nr:SulP family inorganic anion transporter [Sulfuriflexus mobilis]